MVARLSRILPFPSAVPLAGLFLMLLSGCVTAPQQACSIQSAKVDLATHYTLVGDKLAFGPLPRGFLAQADLYRIGVSRSRIHPCEYLKIRKELYLRRNPDAALDFTETRKFYAQDGTLIASHTEDLSSQLRASGFYSATTVLPIPRSAPAGNYLIVSRLSFRRRGERRNMPLARAEETFTIVPRSTGAPAALRWR